MQDKLFQPVVFNLITIVAMVFTLFQLMAMPYRNQLEDEKNATAEVIELFEKLAAEGGIEDETLSGRLAAEQQDQRIRLSGNVLVVLIAIMANIVANYIGRGRHFKNTARIRKLEAEIRGIRGDD